MMTIPDELRELNRLSLKDQAAFVSAATAGDQKSWLYFFPFLHIFSGSADRTLLWDRCDGAICLYYLWQDKDGLRLDLYFPPFPFSVEAMRSALERVSSFNGSRSSFIIWVDERQKALVESEGFRVEVVEQEFIYDSEQVRSIRGKQFERLRRKLNIARRLPGLHIREYRREDEGSCKQLYKRWRRVLRDEKGVKVEGHSYTMRCLEHALSFDGDLLRGEVITVDDRICAFTFGGRISSSHGSIFVTVSDHDVPGLGYLQRHSLISNSPDIAYFNDSSDVGRGSLGDVKRAFNPVEMHAMYRAKRKGAAPGRRVGAPLRAHSPDGSKPIPMISFEKIAALVREAVYRDLASYRVAELAMENPTLHASVLVKPRSQGQRLDRLWVNGRGGTATLLEALHMVQGFAVRYQRPMDAIEINIAHSFQRLTPADAIGELPRRLTGLKGLLLRAGERTVGVAPTEMIAANRSLENSRDRLLKENGLSADDLRSGRAELFLFDAFAVLVHLGPPARATLLYRGGHVVPPAAITQAEVRRTADDMSTWMCRQVNEIGRMVYKYWPSSGRESDGDNTIRQWMATVCLNRIALRTGSTEQREIADRNLEHNLAKYFRDENGHGVALEGEKVKLGGVALAALAIHENPSWSRFSTPLAQLRATIDHLWQPDGSFRTFLRPAERNDCQNFYPGETLLLWASLLDAAPDEALRERFLKSFEYYRGFFEANPNPAFVPWHTQAYCLALRKRDNRELVDFVFRMNDWLLDMQQWDAAPHPDLKGRFYNPAHPEYGPPHASSTGVYLEGLIDAFVLARRLGESERALRYRTAIVRGLRSLRQLQFRSEDDMFYITRRERVFGGVRTEMYDNTIRCDNVQHGLMGILKILQEFAEADYRLPPVEQSQAAAAAPAVDASSLTGGPASD